ncbi:MAG: hypothetical protein JJLCMIEE_00246 [Acidimicrobiales bacterium]|nr:MAG: SH3 domain-containing protein [Actinomycetota bacterium]MBV6507205.1 hypothetical protein [Acidimicrobiales bacterium]RIK05509.1 MAG: hypothetical protein DCC48_09430 [Acidobacteriota bacterium]
MVVNEDLPSQGADSGEGETPLLDAPAPVRRRRRFAGYAGLVVLGVAIFVAIAFGAITLLGEGQPDDRDGTDTTTSAPGTSSTVEAAPETTEAVSQDPGQPGQWVVTGVAASEGLNVRAGPGTEAEVVAQLEPFSRDVMGTGKTQDVAGVLWQEIEVEGGTGWVSSEFLAPFTPCESPAAPASATEASRAGFDFDGDGKDDTLLVYTSGDGWHLRADLADGGSVHALLGSASEVPKFTTAAGFDVTGDYVDEAVLVVHDGSGDVYRFVQMRHCELVPLETNEGEEFTLREASGDVDSYSVTCGGEGGQFSIQQIYNERLPTGGWQATVTHWAVVGNAFEIQKVDVADALPNPVEVPEGCKATA